MKTTLLAASLALAGALFAAPAGLLAQNANSLLSSGGAPVGNGTFAIRNINVSTPNTPEYTTQSNDATTKRYTLGKWLEVEVEFSSTAPTPEVTLHYSILIGGKMLVGDQTLLDVGATPGGQGVFTVVFVSPKTLATILRGQPLSPSSITNIDVQILRPGVSQPLANKMLKEGAAFYTTAQQIPGYVLNKSQTPFAMLWYDHYEQVKENTGNR